MARASYSTTPLLRSLVHRPQGVILVIYHAITVHLKMFHMHEISKSLPLSSHAYVYTFVPLITSPPPVYLPKRLQCTIDNVSSVPSVSVASLNSDLGWAAGASPSYKNGPLWPAGHQLTETVTGRPTRSQTPPVQTTMKVRVVTIQSEGALEGRLAWRL